MELKISNLRARQIQEFGIFGNLIILWDPMEAIEEKVTWYQIHMFYISIYGEPDAAKFIENAVDLIKKS